MCSERQLRDFILHVLAAVSDFGYHAQRGGVVQAITRKSDRPTAYLGRLVFFLRTRLCAWSLIRNGASLRSSIDASCTDVTAIEYLL